MGANTVRLEADMLDHPTISDPTYHTTLVTWHDGSLHFFEPLPPGSDGSVLLNLYFATYIFIILIGLGLALLWQKRGSFRVTRREVFDGFIMATVGGAFGARLGEVIFYHPEYFLENPRMIVEATSGYSIHGAILGFCLSLLIWSRWIKKPYLHILDQGAILLATGTFIGRITNFMLGELAGRSASPDLPWAMRFPFFDPEQRTIVADKALNAYQVLENANGHAFLEPVTIQQGFNIAENLGIARYPLGDAHSQNVIAVYELITDPRHPVMLYQALSDGLLLMIVLIIVRSRTKTVGVLSAATMIGYGLSRTAMEFFRQPETAINYPFLGLTIGQLLSLSLAGLGGLALWQIRKRPIEIMSLPINPNSKNANASKVQTQSSERG